MQISAKATKFAAVIGVASLLAAGAATATSAPVAGADETPMATYEEVLTYCKPCHFINVENQNIASWNQTNIDFAMVESMMPMLDDETIQGLVNYFGTIEPAEQQG